MQAKEAKDSLSIVFREEAVGHCEVCAEDVGRGPIGWVHGKGPMCDACLTEKNQHLGMVLIMANLVREFGQRISADADEDLHLMAILMSMARLYAASAAKSWPHRPLDFLEDFGASLAHREENEHADA